MILKDQIINNKLRLIHSVYNTQCVLSVGQDPEIRSAGEAVFPMILRIFLKIRDQSGSGPDSRQENESPNLESSVLRVYSRKNIESGIDQFNFDRDTDFENFKAAIMQGPSNEMKL
ncbi:Hypothetical_protein [Hexamita inflata]|uniref:Hypothetical_protein n=1 Tax=Hexamita inflata TaxID=28002 RepID=A0AA86PT94_9EUKA|nr:Hypothetical protein HINF_LOCUS33560 [Hexamita inflata]